MDYFQYFVILMGVYCIVRGIMTITTGKVSATEENSLAAFSENGKKKFKLFNAVYNIVGGLVCVAVGVIRLMNIVDGDLFRIAVIIVLALMIISYFAVRSACKKMA